MTGRVAADDAGEAIGQPKLMHQRDGESFRLVGADGELHAHLRQPVHGLDQAGIGHGMDREVLLIIIEQYGQAFA